MATMLWEHVHVRFFEKGQLSENTDQIDNGVIVKIKSLLRCPIWKKKKQYLRCNHQCLSLENIRDELKAWSKIVMKMRCDF